MVVDMVVKIQFAAFDFKIFQAKNDLR